LREKDNIPVPSDAARHIQTTDVRTNEATANKQRQDGMLWTTELKATTMAAVNELTANT